MELAFVINSLAQELTGYTTTHLALAALKRGHRVWYIELGSFTLDRDEMVHTIATRPPRANYRSAKTLLEDLKSSKAIRERITIDTLDVLMLRYDPSREIAAHPWVAATPLFFARLALRHKVIVLNDPKGLRQAANKLYLELFPRWLRPRALVTRDQKDILSFLEQEGGTMVIKPLMGSGGHNVFLVRPEDAPNLHQIIDAVLSDGYALAQEYLPDAQRGDVRLFLMNGQLLEQDGKVAALYRHQSGGDMRANLTAGGFASKAHLEDVMLDMVNAVRSRLVKDGMFLVGLDIAGSKLMEINVFSPGGLVGASTLMKVNFMETVMDALEYKVSFAQRDHNLANWELATL